jgi:hypothetical protein
LQRSPASPRSRAASTSRWERTNALVRLSERTFLEIIAIDPEGTKPSRPRWFDLDNIALQAELTERPRLIHWVARTTGIERAAAACPDTPGRSAPDGARRVSLANHDPRRRQAAGERRGPTLIEWDVPQHPAESLPKSNVSIAGMAASHPEPALIRAALASLGQDSALPVTYDRDVRLAAMLARLAAS